MFVRFFSYFSTNNKQSNFASFVCDLVKFVLFVVNPLKLDQFVLRSSHDNIANRRSF